MRRVSRRGRTAQTEDRKTGDWGLGTGDETGDSRPGETEEEAGEVTVAQTWPCPKEGLA